MRPTFLAAALAALTSLAGCTTRAYMSTEDFETTVVVVPLKYAPAEKLVETLNQIYKSPDGEIPMAVEFVADTRSNSVIIRGPRGEVENAQEVIADLDRKVE